MYTLSLAGAMSLFGAASANAANVFNPTYMPKAGEGYVKGGTHFVSDSIDGEESASGVRGDQDDGIQNINDFNWEFGYGVANGLTLKVGNTTSYKHGSYSTIFDDASMTRVALNYRFLDDQNKLDVYFAWDVQFADKDEDYDSNWLNLGVKFGQDNNQFAYNVGAEISYGLSAEKETNIKMELDSALMYGLNADLMYKFNDKLSGNFDLALNMYSDVDAKNKTANTKTSYSYDLSYKAGLALNYQLRENTTLRGKLGYETAGAGDHKADGSNVSLDNEEHQKISLGFEVAVAF